MKINGVRAPDELMQKVCPFCFKDLSWKQRLKRKTRKMCRCPSCKRVIDERYVVW